MTTTLTQNDPESLVGRIIEELRANPDAQALLLRALLTDEFLGMPIRLKRVEADVAQLKVDVSVLKTDVTQLKTDVTQLKTDVTQLKTDVAQLKGDGLEVKLYRRIRPLLSQRFNLRRARIIQGSLQDPRADFFDPVEKAFDAEIITDAQESRISATDLIIRAQRKKDLVVVWVAVEVSNQIGQHDIERVRESADALSAVFQQEALAVVVGYRIHTQDQERAEQAAVHILRVEERADI